MADHLRDYDQAVGAGMPEGQLAAADRLLDVALDQGLPEADRVALEALALHLRGVASLGIGDDALLARSLERVRVLARGAGGPEVAAVHAILAFCSYYTTGDKVLLASAFDLFGARGARSAVARLETATAINEIRTHSLALGAGVAGSSPDRVRDLAGTLLSGGLAPRLEALLAETLGNFYGTLALTYGDVRLLRQGLSLVGPIALRAPDGAVADAALAAAWQLLSAGLEFDAGYAVDRALLARSQRRVRGHRASGAAPDRLVSAVAVGLGLRARFEYERRGGRSGVLRALAWLRIAARDPLRSTPLATTMRVAYEAGLGERYLAGSLAAFEAMRASPGYVAEAPQDTNFASTLMLMGNVARDPALLARAIGLYEGAIAADGHSAVNVSRYINLASAIQSYVGLAGDEGDGPGDVGDLLMRGLDAVIRVEVLDSPGSTHAGVRHAIASSYFSKFGAALGADAEALFLRRVMDLFDGVEARWPVGFARFLCARVVAACSADVVDCDLLLRCGAALGKVRLLLQAIDLCDGGDAAAGGVDGMFSAAVAMLRHFVAEGRDADGLLAIDALTAGFVRHAASGPAAVGDPLVSDVLRRAIAGSPLSDDDVARVRLSPLSSAGPDPSTPPIHLPGQLRLDILRAGEAVLALRRDAGGLAARLLAARAGALANDDPELVLALADFALEAGGDPWVGFRNVAPAEAHDLFNALRAEVEARGAGTRVLRHGARGLGEPIEELRWDRGAPPRFLLAHSPVNSARPLAYGSALAARLRELGPVVAELAHGACRRDAIARGLADADVLMIVSHGERGASDRILLSGGEHADAEWLLGLGEAMRGKCVFLVACNSGHFNARLTHDDIGLASLALALGGRGAFSTLRSIDELSITLLVVAAMARWRSGEHLSLALDGARRELVAYDELAWDRAIMEFVRGDAAARASAGGALDVHAQSRADADRADVDVGWTFVLG